MRMHVVWHVCLARLVGKSEERGGAAAAKAPVLSSGPLGLIGTVVDASVDVGVGEPSSVKMHKQGGRAAQLRVLYLPWLRAPPASSLLVGLKKKPPAATPNV
jgi:hypothetical protein